ncbi:hypothetical protein MNBD_UNCLBAC01-765 [hydrothermal vent metagenome]|uniref:Lipoyl-binding domain-containing protein n=1 Tax=hydrothermal vent metagenome TaxID=652676 RepID=A0A3B1DM45_9ZZZZ
MHKIILPPLGEGIEKATLVCWHCKPGDQITLENDVAEVVTDKATFNVPADRAGIIKDLCVSEGSDVNIGEALVTLE